MTGKLQSSKKINCLGISDEYTGGASTDQNVS